AAQASAARPADAVTNAEAVLWARLFNVRYRMVLQELALVLVTRKDPAGGQPLDRQPLIDRVLHLDMKVGLRSLALALVKMRRQGLPADGHPEVRAAPPFELPPGSMPALDGMSPDQAAAALKAALKANVLQTRKLA